MSGHLDLACPELKDPVRLKQAAHQAIKDIFPNWQGEIETAKGKEKLYIKDHNENMLPVDMKISVNSLESSARVIVITETGQRLVYPSAEVAKAESMKKGFKISKMENSWLYKDIGWYKAKDGSYTKTASDVDMGTGRYKSNSRCGLFGADFDNRLKAWYTASLLSNNAAQAGCKMVSNNMNTVGQDQLEVEFEMSEDLVNSLIERAALMEGV
jgi:hypothetical protein